MATIYEMKCPQCGHRFEAVKGIFVSECGKPVPREREEEVPFRCPKCGKEFRVTDDDFQANVESVMMAD